MQARKLSGIHWCLGIAVGALVGIGGYTFRYAEGLSYFSTDPRACVNCHIMQPQYDSWQKSSHKAVASCVDCHLPHDFVGKYLAKAENGYRHSKEFTLQNFHEPIMMRAKSREILQANCVSCHSDTIHHMGPGQTPDVQSLDCTHCHQRVGHGEPAGLGGPMRPHEWVSANRSDH